MSVKFFSQDSNPAQYFPAMLSSIIGENEEVKALAVKEDYVGLIKFFVDNGEKILSCEEEVELVNIFGVLASFIAEIKVTKDFEVVNSLISLLELNPQEKSSFKISSLQLIFNIVPVDTKSRYFAYAGILKIALAGGLTHMISDFDNIKSWVEIWGVNNQQIAQLFHLMSDVAAANNNIALVSQFSYEFLKLTREDASKHALATVVAALHAPSVQVCVDPFRSYDRLLKLKPVSKLGGAPVELLKLLATGTFEEYSTYITTPEAIAFVEEHKICVDTLRSNMISLVLSSSFAPGSTLTFAEVGEKIGLTDQFEIEEAVVESAALGQINAKINQKAGTVRFDSRVPRTLAPSTSAELQQRLEAWVEALNTTRQSVQETIVKSGVL